jgi:hypothetical protein
VNVSASSERCERVDGCVLRLQSQYSVYWIIYSHQQAQRQHPTKTGCRQLSHSKARDYILPSPDDYDTHSPGAALAWRLGATKTTAHDWERRLAGAPRNRLARPSVQCRRCQWVCRQQRPATDASRCQWHSATLRRWMQQLRGIAAQSVHTIPLTMPSMRVQRLAAAPCGFCNTTNARLQTRPRPIRRQGVVDDLPGHPPTHQPQPASARRLS